MKIMWSVVQCIPEYKICCIVKTIYVNIIIYGVIIVATANVFFERIVELQLWRLCVKGIL